MFTLNNSEINIFKKLQAVRDLYFPKAELRVAGGWVRDRVLGRENDDIDIMLCHVSGLDFARAVCEYYNLSMHCVRANPDASKHLETAGLKMGNYDLDFATARQEIYDTNSRIPLSSPSDAYGDAIRRDFTINSLFYNIDTGVVEDFTGFGLQDLSLKIIRTPRDPRKTFSDDPLRMIRGIRFASKLNFKIEAETLSALSDRSIIELLVKKVSRERIISEINKAVGNNFYVFVYYLIVTGIASDFTDIKITKSDIRILRKIKSNKLISFLLPLVLCREDKYSAIDKLFSNLPFSKKEKGEAIRYLRIASNPLSSRKIIVDERPTFDEVVEISDILKIMNIKHTILNDYELMRFNNFAPLVNGDEIKEIFKVSNGLEIKRIKNMAKDIMISFPFLSKKETIEKIEELLR